MKKETKYLAVGHDRHTDDWYHAFTSVDDAVSWCNAEEAKYPDYKFVVSPISGWVYYSNAGDELPKFHVEKIDVD